jgi:hypothetical protein
MMPADEVRALVNEAIVRLRQVAATSGPFADPGETRLQLQLAIHDLEVAIDALVRHGLLKP